MLRYRARQGRPNECMVLSSAVVVKRVTLCHPPGLRSPRFVDSVVRTASITASPEGNLLTSVLNALLTRGLVKDLV